MWWPFERCAALTGHPAEQINDCVSFDDNINMTSCLCRQSHILSTSKYYKGTSGYWFQWNAYLNLAQLLQIQLVLYIYQL